MAMQCSFSNGNSPAGAIVLCASRMGRIVETQVAPYLATLSVQDREQLGLK